MSADSEFQGRPRRKTFLIILAAIVVLTAIVAAEWPRSGENKQGNIGAELLRQVRSDIIPVSVATVIYGPISRTLSLTGTIESRGTATVSTPMPGQMQAVYVAEGQHVQSGQLLGQLEHSQIDIQVKQASEQVAAAESQYVKALAGQRLVHVQAAGDAAEAEVGLQEAQAGLAKAEAGAGAAAIAQAEDGAREAHAAAREAAEALKRTRFLYEHGVAPLSSYEDVQSKADQAKAGADSTDAAVQSARQGASLEDRKIAALKVTQARDGMNEAIHAEHSREAVAQSDTAIAQTQVQSSRAGLRAAASQLDRTHIISPLNGIVTAVQVHAGESAMPGSPLFTITSLGVVYFETTVSATEKLQLSVGQDVVITLQELPGRTLFGKVSTILPVVNPGSEGFAVRISIWPIGVVIPPGSYARAVVQTASSTRALVIPTTAIITDSDGQKSVYLVINHNHAQLQHIAIGISTPTDAQVLTGLQRGDQIVTTGAELLHPGSTISIQPAGNEGP